MCVSNDEGARELVREAFNPPKTASEVLGAALDTRQAYYGNLKSVLRSEKEGMLAAWRIMRDNGGSIDDKVLQRLVQARLQTRDLVLGHSLFWPLSTYRRYDAAIAREVDFLIQDLRSIKDPYLKQVEFERVAVGLAFDARDAKMPVDAWDVDRKITAATQQSKLAAGAGNVLLAIELAPGMLDVYQGLSQKDKPRLERGLTTIGSVGLGAGAGYVIGAAAAKVTAGLAVALTFTPAGWIVAGAGVAISLGAGYYLEPTIDAAASRLAVNFADVLDTTFP